MEDWLFVISPNGLGHFKRVTGLVDHMIQIIPNRHFHIFCAEWQLNRMRDEVWVQGLISSGRVTFHFGYTDLALRWSSNPSDFEGRNLISWIDKVRQNPLLNSAELVISDNLVEILLLRKDALLMGSFLWGDVLQHASFNLPAVNDYIQKEQLLLEEYHPKLLCVQDMVMPYAAERTQVIGLPWFTERVSCTTKKSYPRKRVGLLPGATPALREQIESYAKTLAVRDDIDVLFPGSIEGCKNFDFQAETWDSLDVVICRPGIGTLTDAIKYSVPVLALEEPENVEISHNALRVDQLGIGLSASIGSYSTLENKLDQMLQTPQHQQYIDKLMERPIGGYVAAVQWLSNYVGLSPQ